MPNTFTLISSATVGSGGVTNITLSSIPQTYTDLQLLFSTRDDGGSFLNNVAITFNGNTSGIYSERLIYGYNNTVQTTSNSGATVINFAYSDQSLATANTFSNNTMYIPNYTGSTNKSVSIDSVTENNNATNAIASLSVGLFASTSPITSINLYAGGALFVQYATVYLYGIKNS